MRKWMAENSENLQPIASLMRAAAAPTFMTPGSATHNAIPRSDSGQVHFSGWHQQKTSQIENLTKIKKFAQSISDSNPDLYVQLYRWISLQSALGNYDDSIELRSCANKEESQSMRDLLLEEAEKCGDLCAWKRDFDLASQMPKAFMAVDAVLSEAEAGNLLKNGDSTRDTRLQLVEKLSEAMLPSPPLKQRSLLDFAAGREKWNAIANILQDQLQLPKHFVSDAIDFFKQQSIAKGR